jgi:hypothetical protein
MALLFNSYAVELRVCLKNTNTAPDSLCNVWVVFSDKTGIQPESLGKRALQRRAKARFVGTTPADFPVTQHYISRVIHLGGTLRNVFKWANAASFSIPASHLKLLAQQPYVHDILPVRGFTQKIPVEQLSKKLLQKTSANSASIYGLSEQQQQMLRLPAAHRFIQSGNAALPGDSVLVALFDGGFWLNHRCFDFIRGRNAVIADSDFVEHDGDVSDGDSLRNLYLGLGYEPPELHGTQTLSLIAGYDPPNFMGGAWGATFVLAKTEWSSRIINNTVVEIERHSEEDNWAAAIVWAESLGVDIVSSSLGYSTGFTDSMGNADTSADYRLNDYDGKTTIISIAASAAAQRGMIIVNAVGNDGPSATSLSAPADVQDVITVGGVNPDKSIANFSSRGPTSDGRIKPDLVAQTTQIYLPDPYSYGSVSYSSGNMGTSFSTPMIAGLVALIRQKYPADSATQIRQRLYCSCFFTSYQNDTDNTYGRGIPDAFLACLPDSTSYMQVADSAGHALSKAVVYTAGKRDSMVCDSFGIAILPASIRVPETLLVSHALFASDTVILRSRHTRAEVFLNPLYKLHVVLADTAGTALAGSVFFKTRYDTGYSSITIDSSGNGDSIRVTDSIVTLYAKSQGYFTSKEQIVHVGQAVDTIWLVPRNAAQFILYPTVLDISRKHQHLTLSFVASQDNPRDYSQLMRVSIRTMSGTLVWTNNSYLAQHTPVTIVWPEPGRTIVPGMYFFVVDYAGKIYKKKFIVIG